MKTKLLIIASVLILIPTQMVYGPPAPDHEYAFYYAEHVVIGKILSVQIISEPQITNTETSYSEQAGVALYEIEVEEYLKSPLGTDIMKVPGYFSHNFAEPQNVIEPLYDVGEKVFLYIQPDSNETVSGYDFIIRSYESRSLDRTSSICDEPYPLYHNGKCIANEESELVVDPNNMCSLGTSYVKGKCVVNSENENKNEPASDISDEPVCGRGTKLVDGVCIVPKHDVEPIVHGDCLIATASFGSELSPQVQMLREIRDNTLLNTESGKIFMNGFNTVYYSFSPQVVQLENENPLFKEAVKLFITPMITTLSIMTFAQEDSEFDVIFLGLSTICLIVGMYVVAPITIIYRFRK